MPPDGDQEQRALGAGPTDSGDRTGLGGARRAGPLGDRVQAGGLLPGGDLIHGRRHHLPGLRGRHFQLSAAYPGVRPRDTQLLAPEPGGGLQTSRPFSTGDTALLGLVGVKPENLPSSANDAVAPTGTGDAIAGTVLFDFKVEGAREGRIFLRVVMPLSLPAIASLAIFQFLWVWNDLLVALVFASFERAPLTVALRQQTRQFGSNIDVLAPGAFVSLIVPLVVFFAFQRYYVQGVLSGSVK
jgi:Binding-protein-dependent transport system inner membrane component